MPENNTPERSLAETSRLLWLKDVSKAAQHLTRLTLESSAQAALITRQNELWAYAGQLSRDAAQELAESVQRYWDSESESDLLRFVRLQSTEAQHMLYVRKLSDNMTLALVFDAETPFSTIRLQAGKLIKNLIESSQHPREQVKSTESATTSKSDIEMGDNGDFQEIPPISELLGEVPPPVPLRPAINTRLPWKESEREAPTRSGTGAANTSGRFSRESSPPVFKPLQRRPVAAMDETNAAPALARIPDDMQATRRQEVRIDPQSLVETRVQTVGDGATEPAHRILIEPPSLYQVNLSYACLLVPRIEQHHLIGDAAARLNEWVPQICVAFGWRLEYISVRPEYLQWIVRVPLASAAGKVIYTIRKHTSDRFFDEFPRFKQENPSGEFWAPGFIVQGGSQPHPQKQVRDFIRQTRIRQGLR